MSKLNVLKKIRDRYETYGPRQKMLADYILSHSDEAAFMTAGALGEAAGVSEATVLRFAASLGEEDQAYGADLRRCGPLKAARRST